MAGLGIAGLIKHTADSGGGGGGRDWIKNWHPNGTGEITVWLHTLAPIVPSFSHSFMYEDTYTDKETNREVPVLRYPRFVSPDPEIVHRSQYFREDDGTLKVIPDRDPFLLLREWLRSAEHIGIEEPIFKWEDPKNRQTVVWDRGELSGLVKRGRVNFGHSLDTKLEYVFVFVDNSDVAAGPRLSREGKLVSQKIVEVIKQQQDLFGVDEGDPIQNPYAFRLIGDGKANSPMNAYKAYKDERAEYTTEVYEQVAREEFPDPTPFGEQAEGDMSKIRAAFEAAAQVELPLDELFSEDSNTRRNLLRGAKRPAPRPSKAAQSKAAAEPSRSPPVPSKKTAAPGAAPATPTPTQTPQGRRKKVEPKPDPAPVDTIPCDECKHPMLPTDAKCENCGTEYEVEEAAAPPPPKPAPKPRTAVGPKAPAKPAKPGNAAPAKAAPKVPPPLPAELGPDCWSCGADLGGEIVCPSCGIEQGDQLPF